MQRMLEMFSRAPQLVKELSERVDGGVMSFMEAERCIQEFLNSLGTLMDQEVLNGVKEPVEENRVEVEGAEVVYEKNSPLSFIARWGERVSINRRRYKFVDPQRQGGWCPLDEKLGLDRCKGFSPLLSYLLSLFGVTDPYDEASQLLSQALGFPISATALQNNTEAVGQQLDADPYKNVEAGRRRQRCSLMAVEVDGTTSPQISAKEGISGRASLKLPTQYKECNVVTIQKYDRGGRQIDSWVGARYGERLIFNEYVRKAALAMGQEAAEGVLFIADGTKTNWQIRADNFPGATEILDFYHVAEHLGEFCGLFKDTGKGQRQYPLWRQMLKDGEVLQVISEMATALPQLTNGGEGATHVSYFQTNKERMKYDDYRKAGWPIGSGKVEGSCKYVVGKRFKRNGMRWKKLDNEAVLEGRLAKLNGRLQSYFVPRPRKWAFHVAA
jgi:hypothetical protein